MNAKQGSTSGAGATGNAGKLSISQLPIEQARANLRMLLLANPNYFGNVAESGLTPVLNISGDTSYEALGCVGLSLSLSRLEAVVSIQQTTGYDGGVCSSGSQEYVRFYLSFDGGSTWQDQGVAGFAVYDIPGPKPLEYSVALPVTLPEDFCFFENLPRARAILSWNYIPPANTPGYTPVWGNVVDVTIQSPASDFIILDKALSLAKVKLPSNLAEALDLSQKIPAAPKKSLSAAELTKVYQGKAVPAARFLYPEITKLSGTQNVAAFTTASASESDSALPVSASSLLEAIATILSTSGNTDYEELDCVGLDPNRSTLVGVVNVKLPYGFNGGLCTAGSTEYIAFWVDWGSGYQYAGTATVNTHDISSFPSGGLDYAVVLPVDVASHMQPCTNGAQTAKVRAILSWQTPPPRERSELRSGVGQSGGRAGADSVGAGNSGRNTEHCDHRWNGCGADRYDGNYLAAGCDVAGCGLRSSGNARRSLRQRAAVPIRRRDRRAGCAVGRLQVSRVGAGRHLSAAGSADAFHHDHRSVWQFDGAVPGCTGILHLFAEQPEH